ncbi:MULTISPECIES: hypothetical protein [unclassified Bradyrhizobium]|uniref:hypothetical protein n=1 Tax=unclassified Bradyrhizobium TaxID=2631580 RepID=UPI0024E0BCF1|nr:MULTISPECIES: hypothetical protein [unclassified Bradyrhizobium]
MINAADGELVMIANPPLAAGNFDRRASSASGNSTLRRRLSSSATSRRIFVNRDSSTRAFAHDATFARDQTMMNAVLPRRSQCERHCADRTRVRKMIIARAADFALHESARRPAGDVI